MTVNHPKIMRDVFIEQIYNKMKEDEKIFFLSADLGAPTLDKLRKDFLTRMERTLRYPNMFILDRKGALAANIKVREEVKRLIAELGLNYYEQATGDLIEDSRRTKLYRVRQRTVPGRFRNPMYLEIYLKDKPVPAYARKDAIRLIPADIQIKPSGEIDIGFEGAGDWGRVADRRGKGRGVNSRWWMVDGRW
jgi:N-methylhydantoinase B/oxoprolinase/acetone carboxylase alpha subunit